jgi:hypothetical protein
VKKSIYDYECGRRQRARDDRHVTPLHRRQNSE